MSYFINTPKVGRSQGASIFWGLISVCFAAAACFYYWKNHENETKANMMRDQVLQLTEETESLNSQKEHLQASKAEAQTQLKTREDLVQEKETELAAEETRLEGMGHQSQVQSQQNLAQVAVVKKFNDAIRKFDKDADVLERYGRPVLRIPAAQLFDAGDATLKPEGKTVLNQIAQSLAGQLDSFEMRVACYTDSDAEGQKKDSTDSKTPSTTSWDLTAARAASLSRFFRDQTPLPFQNLLVVGRGDADSISRDDHVKNRRVEISINPLPIPFRAPDTDKPKTASTTTANSNADSTADSSATAVRKDKPKDKAGKTSAH